MPKIVAKADNLNELNGNFAQEPLARPVSRKELLNYAAPGLRKIPGYEQEQVSPSVVTSLSDQAPASNLPTR